MCCLRRSHSLGAGDMAGERGWSHVCPSHMSSCPRDAASAPMSLTGGSPCTQTLPTSTAHFPPGATAPSSFLKPPGQSALIPTFHKAELGSEMWLRLPEVAWPASLLTPLLSLGCPPAEFTDSLQGCVVQSLILILSFIVYSVAWAASHVNVPSRGGAAGHTA